MGSYDDMLRNVQTDTIQWESISSLKAGQKPPLPGETAESVQQVAKAVLSPGKTINEEDTKRIASLRNKSVNTENHVRSLIHALDDSDPEKIKITLTALHYLKETLNNATNQGINQLKTTYADQTTADGKQVSELLTTQQRRIANGVIGEIDKHIINLGQKLQTMPSASAAARQQKLQQRRENSITARAFDAASAVLSTQQASPTIASTVDATFDKRWQGVVASGNDKVVIRKEPIRQQAANPETIPRVLILANMERKPDDTTPSQFEKDLPRMEYFLVNGRIKFDFARRFQTKPEEARSYLHEACQKAVGEEKAALLQHRIENIVDQGLYVDMIGKIHGVYSSPKLKDNMGGTSSGFMWSVNFVDDKVEITLKVSYDLLDSDKYSENIRPGTVIAKRTYEIPISSLLATDEEIQKEPLPGVTVKDSYSQLIKSPVYANALLLGF